MTYADGWAAMNLDMSPRVPREEFDAENHWPLVRAVTGIDVGVESDEETKQRAAWSNATVRPISSSATWTPACY